MSIDDIVQKNIGKRPLLREKLKERRKNELYSEIPDLEKFIKKKNELGISILKKTIQNLDISNEKREFEKIESEIKDLFKNYGLTEEYLSVKYICEKCQDTGYFNGGVCSCILESTLDERITESGLNSSSRNKNFDNFNFDLFDGSFKNGNTLINAKDYMKKLFNFSKNYCENIQNINSGVFFYGKSGVGKTYLSTAILNYSLDLGKICYFIKSSELFDLLNSYAYSFYREKLELKEKIDFVKSAELLIIDDLGSEEPHTKQNNSFLSSILDYRIENNLATIINSNYNEYDLAEVYDTRISSRIRGYFKFFPFPDEDLRIKR